MHARGVAPIVSANSAVPGAQQAVVSAAGAEGRSGARVHIRIASMAAWSVQKQVKVAGLLTLSIALFYLAFTIDRVDGKVFEHTNVVQLDANSFDDKVGDSVRPTNSFLYWNAVFSTVITASHSSGCLAAFSLFARLLCGIAMRSYVQPAVTTARRRHLDAPSHLPPDTVNVFRAEIMQQSDELSSLPGQ